MNMSYILNGPIKKSKPKKNDLFDSFKVGDIKQLVNGPKRKLQPAKRNLQKSWNIFPEKKKQSLRKKYKDTDKDGKPDKWDCQPFNILAQDTLYSVRGFHELNPKKKIHSSDKYSRMRGRSTGWFGTGMYGYNNKNKALKDAKENKGYVREEEIKNPLRLNSSQSDYLHERVSKNLFYAKTKDEKRNAAEALSFALNKGWRGSDNFGNKHLNAGMSRDFSEKDIDDIQKKAITRDVNPINIAAKMAGYDGIVTGEEQQNRKYGSIKFYEDEIPYKHHSLNLDEKKRKRSSNLLHQRDLEKKRINEVNNKIDNYGKILSTPYPIHAEIVSNEDGDEVLVKYNKEQKIDAAKKFYGEENIKEAEEWKHKIDSIDPENDNQSINPENLNTTISRNNNEDGDEE